MRKPGTPWGAEGGEGGARRVSEVRQGEEGARVHVVRQGVDQGLNRRRFVGGEKLFSFLFGVFFSAAGIHTTVFPLVDVRSPLDAAFSLFFLFVGEGVSPQQGQSNGRDAGSHEGVAREAPAVQGASGVSGEDADAE